MTRRHVYIAVEGPQDVEFLGRLLDMDFALRRKNRKGAISPFWLPLVPTRYPFGGSAGRDGDDLSMRAPVPVFFERDTLSVAVHAVGGDTRLADAVGDTRDRLTGPGAALDAIGAVLDADTRIPARQRFKKFADALRERGLQPPGGPGQVTAGSPPVGIFVLPDNAAEGTLEQILLECADATYPELAGAARRLVDGIPADRSAYDPEDLVDFEKPAGRAKATVACIGGVLRPGKAIQVSLQDNRWVCPKTRELPRVKAVTEFLAGLLGEPTSGSSMADSAPCPSQAPT